MTDRPHRVVVIAGTGTEVGKTWVAARLIEALRARGVSVSARKPAQSFEPGEEPTDAEVLADAAGEPPDSVCSPARSYEVAMAPFMAADVLGRPPFTMTDLAGEITWPANIEVGIVESVGGVRSPISSEGSDTVDLARRVGAVLVVVVADAGLGTINAVRLSAGALHGFDVVVFLNRYDADSELHTRNREWLEAHLAETVLAEVSRLADVVAGR